MPAKAEGPAHVEWGWKMLDHPRSGTQECHLMPLFDTGVHAFDTDCGCRPVEHDPGIITHNAFDRREDYETGKRKHH